jgi:putative transposase
MTIDGVVLRELVEKGSVADLLRKMIPYVTSQLMQIEVDGLMGASHDTRIAERTNRRNGYRGRKLQTCAGTVNVLIPKLRKGRLFPGVSLAARAL